MQKSESFKTTDSRQGRLSPQNHQPSSWSFVGQFLKSKTKKAVIKTAEFTGEAAKKTYSVATSEKTKARTVKYSKSFFTDFAIPGMLFLFILIRGLFNLITCGFFKAMFSQEMQDKLSLSSRFFFSLMILTAICLLDLNFLDGVITHATIDFSSYAASSISSLMSNL